MLFKHLNPNKYFWFVNGLFLLKTLQNGNMCFNCMDILSLNAGKVLIINVYYKIYTSNCNYLSDSNRGLDVIVSGW